MPDDLRLDVDVVSHSRGGLVARVLAGELEGGAAPGLSVRRSVFVAAPNNGTALADPDHMVSFIDRHTTLLNVAPPGPLEVLSEVLEAIVTAVEVIGHAAINGLPGLLAMDPNGSFIQQIDAGPAPDADYYAIAATYRPHSGALWSPVRDTAVNAVADRIFEGDANDLVVPTLGVLRGGADPAFPIATERAFTHAESAGVVHTSFFGAPETSRRPLTWLTG